MHLPDTWQKPSRDDIDSDSLEYLFGHKRGRNDVPWVKVARDPQPIARISPEMIRLQAKLETLVDQLELFANKLNRAHHDLGFLKAELTDKNRQLEQQAEHRARAARAIMSDVERQHLQDRILDLERQLDRALAHRYAQQMPPIPKTNKIQLMRAPYVAAQEKHPPDELVLCYDRHLWLAGKHLHDRHFASSMIHRSFKSRVQTQAERRPQLQLTGGPVTTAPGESAPEQTPAMPDPTLSVMKRLMPDQTLAVMKRVLPSDDYFQRAMEHHYGEEPAAFSIPLLPINYALFVVWAASIIVTMFI